MMKMLQFVSMSWTPGNHYYVCRIQECDYPAGNDGRGVVPLFSGAPIQATNVGIMSLRDRSTYHYLEDAAIHDAERVDLGSEPSFARGENGYGCILVVHMRRDASMLYAKRVVFSVPMLVTPETLLAAIV